MSENVFIPRMRPTPSVEQPEEREEKSGGASNLLLQVAQYAVIGLIGLLPVFFVPGLWASLGFDKVMLAIGLSAVTVIMLSLLALRRARVKTVLPISLGLFWLLVMTAMVSGLHSGDIQDAMRGSVFESQTVGFLAVLGLMMTVPLVFQGSKLMSIKALALFACVSTVLLVYNLLRIFLGADFLPVDSFKAVTVSPVGGFNDLAIFSGLIIVLSLITLVQLPLRAWLQSVVAVLIGLALLLLAVVNFFNIWIIVGFFSLLLFVYLLSRDSLFNNSHKPAIENSRILLTMSVLVCIVSAIFVVAGDYVGDKIGDLTNVDYVEVRPSAEATIGVARAVFTDNLYLGVGPNRFTDAWRQHKDVSINETIFWDTDFNAGSGFIPTLFVNTGILGTVLLVLFHLVFLYTGYRMLLRSVQVDYYWYYFGLVSFAGASFIWMMSYLYVPGSGILLLGALFTGMTYVAAGALLPKMVRCVPLALNRQRGFFMMAGAILMITVSVGAVFTVGQQYVAQGMFAQAQVEAESTEKFDQVAMDALDLYPDDRFLSARAQLQLAKLTALTNVSQPSEEQQQQFLVIAEDALMQAEKAVAEDLTNPDHHAILAGIYSNLARVGIDGASERAHASLAEAKRLDPLNPGYYLIEAQLAARIGDIETARSEIAAALNLKRNFTAALYLSAQLDISEGKTESAIATTRAIITLEPKNPTRYFQLGVLLSAAGVDEEAIAAFRAAITLDPAYANARYLLALAHLNKAEDALALEQLQFVLQTNPDNQQLRSLIDQVESGQYEVPESLGFEAPVNELRPKAGFDDTVISTTGVDTDLVAPVNTVSSEPAATTEAEEETEVTEPVAGEETEEGTAAEVTNQPPTE